MNRSWRWPRRPKRPRLTFAPRAWLKLQYLCHAGPTEVGGFGCCAPDNPLYVEDFCTIRQRATQVSVCFEDVALADYFDAGVDRGLRVEQFARVWIHTHPGKSATPTETDWETFERSFGTCTWAVMAILSRTGQTTAHLSLAAGPRLTLPVKTLVDWSDMPPWLDGGKDTLAADIAAWQVEYFQNIQSEPEPQIPATSASAPVGRPVQDFWDPATPDPYLREVFDGHYDPFYF